MDKSLETKRNWRTRFAKRLCSTPVHDHEVAIPSCSSLSDVKSASSSNKTNSRSDSASTSHEGKEKKKIKKINERKNDVSNRVSKRRRGVSPQEGKKHGRNAANMDSDWETMEEFTEKLAPCQKAQLAVNLFESPEKIRDAGRPEIGLISPPLILQREIGVFSPGIRGANIDDRAKRKKKAFTLVLSSSSSSSPPSPPRRVETLDDSSPIFVKADTSKQYGPAEKPEREIEGWRPPRGVDLRIVKPAKTTLADILWDEFVEENVADMGEYNSKHLCLNSLENRVKNTHGASPRPLSSFLSSPTISSSSSEYLNIDSRCEDVLLPHRESLYRKGVMVVRGNVSRREREKRCEEWLENKKITEDPYDFVQHDEDCPTLLPEVTFNRYNTMMKERTGKVNNEEKENDERERRKGTDEIYSTSDGVVEENAKRRKVRRARTISQNFVSSDTSDDELFKISFNKKQDASTKRSQRVSRSIKVHKKMNSRKKESTPNAKIFRSSLRQRDKPRIISERTIRNVRIVR